MKHILKCTKCGTYTLKEKCPECGSKCVEPKPPKFSPDDKYADLKRKAKKEELESQGLL